MNPFKTIDELIDRRYRVPLAAPVSYVIDDWKPSTADHGTVELGELLEVVRIEYIKIQNQNSGMRAALESLPQWCAQTLFAGNQVRQKYFNELHAKFGVRIPHAYPFDATYEERK